MRSLLLEFTAIAVLLLLWLPAVAQSPAEAPVRLNGVPVITVIGNGNETAAARAAKIERRLVRLAEREEPTGPPTVIPGAEDSRIVQLDGTPLVSVTRADAEDAATTVDTLASQWATQIGTALGEARASRHSPWRRLGIEIRGAVTTAIRRLGSSAVRIVPRALASVAVLGLFWAAAASIRTLLRFIFRRIISDLTVENLLKQIVYYSVLAIGILVAADALGFEPGAVITGLGLTGLALGFALKDIISNFVSGLLILALRPFKIGDEIVIGDTEGAVRRIELRATEIHTYDGRLVLVPNAELFMSRVTNNTAAPVRRSSVEIPAGYNTDLLRAREAMISAAESVPEVLRQPEPSVRVRQLGPSDILFELRFWTDSRRSDLLATTSAVREAVVQAFRASDLSLPEPDVRRIHIESDSGRNQTALQTRTEGGRLARKS